VTAQPIVHDIWKEKYRHGEEASINDTFKRMVEGVYALDCYGTHKAEAYNLLVDRYIVPAGRIHAGAGTDKRVTLINCFVSDTIQDSLSEPIEGQPGLPIMKALDDASATQQMGGGIGMDFSPIRPAGALVKRTGSVSSGTLPFMDMWHAMCGTVMSSGSRRGAMMGTLSIWHPDILKFITAKQTPGRLTNFNVSVLVTDDFMECLERDLDWDLRFTVPRADGQHVDIYEREGVKLYVYERMKARALWDKIIENTYIHAEPGIIFVDRVNAMNNMWYCEDIQCSNPCGEQMLPPNGDCNLGHVNLAVMVDNPFTPQATFNYEVLRVATAALARFLDNVLDVSLFPTEAQRQEAMNKRRTGIGFTGLANALQQLRISYGSMAAIETTRKITQEMCYAAYEASIELAKERGSFPAFDREKYLQGNFIKKLPEHIRNGIQAYGIRNAVLMSIAPTGTTSIIAGNVSSGIEPVFLNSYTRKVLQDDGVTFRQYEAYDYGYLKYHDHAKVQPGATALPSYMEATADRLTVDQHLGMQAAAQEWVDSSISKTINCPESMSFEEFRDVYSKAYKLGLKGCTTYRPDPRSGRGAVLAKKEEEKKPPAIERVPMQDVLDGRRYRIKWNGDPAYYIQINDFTDEEGQRRPFELFINSQNAAHVEWTTALAITISAVFRRGGDVTFIADGLRKVFSANQGSWQGERYVPSIVAAIGDVIERHLEFCGLIQKDEPVSLKAETVAIPAAIGASKREICPKCAAPALVAIQIAGDA
jgi:ribonucleoside-diphosphate reductase alpha chain